MPRHLTTTDSPTFVAEAAVGVANGVAGLDSTGKVPSAQLPASVVTGVSSINGHTGAVTLAASDVGAVGLGLVGTANGVAALDSTGKVPSAQLPTGSAAVTSVNTHTGAVTLAASDVGAIATTARGAASGVASLDSSSLVPTAQIPDLSGTYVAASRVGAASGIATLDSGTKVPTAQLPDLSGTYVAASRVGAASGIATLDSTTHLSTAQLPLGVVQYVTPQQYGALGNGSNDDTTAIQAAITAAGTGGTVYFGPGTYVISSTLTLTGGARLLGAGVTVTIIKQTSTTANGISGANITGLTISDLVILGPSSGSGVGLSLTLTGSTPTSYVVLRNLRVRRFGSDGINIATPIVSRFDNVVSDLNGGHGFNVGGSGGSGGTSLSFTACYALGNSQAGYYLNQIQYTNLSGCAADSNGVGYYLNACVDVALTGCGAESGSINTAPWSGHGFVVYGGYGVSLTSCFVYANPAVSFWVTNSAVKILLLGCGDSGPTGTATNSIKIDSNSQVTVSSPATASTNLFSSQTQILNDGSGNFTAWGQILAKTSATVALAVYQSGTAAHDNMIITSTGLVQVGSGAATVDTQIARTGAGALAITNMNTSGAAALNVDGALTALSASIGGVSVVPTGFTASDFGWFAWTYDSTLTTNTSITTSGTLYLAQIKLRTAQTISKVFIGISTAASGVTANENFLGLIDSSGVLRGVTAAGAIDGNLVSGLLTGTLVTPYAAPAGSYWVAFLNNATTPATVARTSGLSLSIAGGGQTSGNYRYAVNGTGLTTIPSSITPGSNTSAGEITMWAAVG